MQSTYFFFKITSPWERPGTFQETYDTRLYSTFNLPLVHGWLASPSSKAYAALSRVAQYHDDIQLLHFRKEDLENRLSMSGSLSPDDDKLLLDIYTILSFVDVENPTQLSSFGLEHLCRSIEPGSINILFRNDHFSTLFKHPRSHKLYTLVTDAGYAGHSEVVWENLVDVNGSNAGFFSGDFRPVGNTSISPTSSQPSQTRTGRRQRVHQQRSYMGDGPAETPQPVNHTEQMDADYAYALSLQFQDEEEQQSNRASGTRRERSHSAQPSGPDINPPARNASNPSLRHRQSSSISSGHNGRQSQNYRPLIPPRPTTNLAPHTHPDPDTENADAPPPSYEQAALSPAYIPEEGQPFHSRSPSIASPSSSSHGFGENPIHYPSRTTYNNSHNRRPLMPVEPTLRPRDRNKDCVVM